jgi:hypothetical protein
VSEIATAPTAEPVTPQHTTLTALVPWQVAGAAISVQIHTDDATFDVILADYADAVVRTGGGTEECPHTYRAASLKIDGQQTVIYGAARQITAVSVAAIA